MIFAFQQYPFPIQGITRLMLGVIAIVDEQGRKSCTSRYR